MGPRMRYMGTKHALAGQVARVIGELRPEKPVIDLFCGMCAVAGAISPSGRSVWGNDVQAYAELVARCMIANDRQAPDPAAVMRFLLHDATQNASSLLERFAADVHAERTVLADPSLSAYRALADGWTHAANDPGVAQEVARLAEDPTAAPYRLCTLTFAWGYFGIEQAIWIDSVRWAIDRAAADSRIDSQQRDWLVLALVQVSSRLCATTGHTAQYIRAHTPQGLARVVQQRRRNVCATMVNQLANLRPFGTARWRASNRVIRRDALELWPVLADVGLTGAVCYADPPYTKNQYSRFYHVLETLTRYDYPEAAGSGRYRPDRFRTPFSTRTGVVQAFHDLCVGVASLDAVLVLSYPEDGMLTRYRGAHAADLLREHFDTVRTVVDQRAVHSSLGAGHGVRQTDVREQVHVAF